MVSSPISFAVSLGARLGGVSLLVVDLRMCFLSVLSLLGVLRDPPPKLPSVSVGLDG